MHELYLKLAESDELDIRDRQHFFRLAAAAIQSIVVDAHRRSRAKKRGGDLEREELSRVAVPGPLDIDLNVMDLTGALAELEDADAHGACVLRLRYFCGFTMPEIAAALDMSVPTVERECRASRAWLARRLSR